MKEAPRILLITLSNIGDLVMTTPLLEALHLAYPNHLIDIVGDARSLDLLRACPYRGRLLIKEKKAGLSGVLSLLSSLREFHYDIAVDLRTPLLTLFIRAGERGFKRRGSSVGRHAVQHHFTALRSLVGEAMPIPNARLWLDEAARSVASHLTASLPGGRTLVVAPGANWPGKIWPIDNYIKLVESCASAFDGVLILGSNEDRAIAQQLARNIALPSIDLAGETGLLEAAACMLGAQVFVGNDSGLGHIAAAMQVPSVTVFGPGEPDRYRPWGPLAEIALAQDGDFSRLKPQTVADIVLAQAQHQAPI